MTFLTWIHVLAAVTWIGGMLFLSLVIVPVLRCPQVAPHRAMLFPLVARQFRLVGWVAMATLVMTGPVLAMSRGIDLGAPSTWPSIFYTKLIVVGLLVALSLVHDAVLGPRASIIARKPEPDRTPSERQFLRLAPLFGRLSLMLALIVLYCAVSLART
ncbi:MAG: hypothetical protein U0172_11815 [Nitrospiraceae bacterium]